MKDVRRLRFFDGSLPMNSDRFCMPFLYRSSASSIQRSSTGLIFWALFGVMSSFSNLEKSNKLIYHVPFRGNIFPGTWGHPSGASQLPLCFLIQGTLTFVMGINNVQDQFILSFQAKSFMSTLPLDSNVSTAMCSPQPTCRWRFGCMRVLRWRSVPVQPESVSVLVTGAVS